MDISEKETNNLINQLKKNIKVDIYDNLEIELLNFNIFQLKLDKISIIGELRGRKSDFPIQIIVRLFTDDNIYILNNMIDVSDANFAGIDAFKCEFRETDILIKCKKITVEIGRRIF